MSRDPRIPWHELLGKALTDALIGLPYSASTEEELALRSQQHDPDELLQCYAPEERLKGLDFILDAYTAVTPCCHEP